MEKLLQLWYWISCCLENTFCSLSSQAFKHPLHSSSDLKAGFKTTLLEQDLGIAVFQVECAPYVVFQAALSHSKSRLCTLFFMWRQSYDSKEHQASAHTVRDHEVENRMAAVGRPAALVRLTLQAV